MELLEELRAIQRDLDELGDAVASALLEKAERCFLAWRFDAGERYMEQTLSRVQKSLDALPATGVVAHFQTCAMAV